MPSGSLPTNSPFRLVPYDADARYPEWVKSSFVFVGLLMPNMLSMVGKVVLMFGPKYDAWSAIGLIQAKQGSRGGTELFRSKRMTVFFKGD